jgi:hypothetical protein
VALPQLVPLAAWVATTKPTAKVATVACKVLLLALAPQLQMVVAVVVP